jgi:hypothetical protein
VLLIDLHAVVRAMLPMLNLPSPVPVLESTTSPATFKSIANKALEELGMNMSKRRYHSRAGVDSHGEISEIRFTNKSCTDHWTQRRARSSRMETGCR